MHKSISVLLFFLSCLFLTSTTSVQAQEVEINIADIDALIQRYYDADVFQGVVLVAVGDDVVYAKGWGHLSSARNVPNGPDSKFRIGSLTKQFTAALVLRLAEEGLIDLSSPISEYFPEYSAQPGSRVTIHQLLNHTSGIPNVPLPDSLSDDSGMVLPGARIGTPGVFELQFEPGTTYRYSNQAYQILGDLVERVTGQTYDEAMQSYIFGPHQLTDSGSHYHFLELSNEALGFDSTPSGRSWNNKNVGRPGAAGNLYSTALDLLKWNRLLYGGAVFKSDQSLTLMTSPGLGDYGYGIRINADSVGYGVRKRYHHGGRVQAFRSNLHYLPESEITVVTLENWSVGRPKVLKDDIRKVIYGIEPSGPQASN